MRNAIYFAVMLPLLMACSQEAAEVVNYPADHGNIIIGNSWSEPVKHTDGFPSNDCNAPDSGKISQCKFTLSKGVDFPKDAKSLRLTLKAKAWIRNIGKQHDSYCLIYGTVLKNATESTNHVIHSEVWSPEIGIKDHRRISYVNINVPVKNGQVVLGVGKEVVGNCQVDIVAYLDGYTM